MKFEGVASKIRRFEALQLCGAEMERKGVGASGKIRGGKGVPRSPGSAASSFTAQVMGESTRRRSVGAETGGLEGGRSGSDGRFADLGSADGEFQGDDHGGRQGTHRTAGPSPRCALGWVAKKIKDIEVSILKEYEEEPLTRESIIFHNASLSKPEVGRFIGKKGHSLRKIECFCGVFFTLSDYETEVEILMWGPLRACALAQFVVEAFEHGFYSIVDSLSYLDL